MSNTIEKKPGKPVPSPANPPKIHPGPTPSMGKGDGTRRLPTPQSGVPVKDAPKGKS